MKTFSFGVILFLIFLFDFLPYVDHAAITLAMEEVPKSSTSSTSLRPWQRHPDNPLIVPGVAVKPGGPINVNIADPSVLYDEEEKKWKMWFASGWDENGRARVLVKYAESDDGIKWTIQDDPAFEMASSNKDWDYTQVETPSVLKNLSAPPERRYMMWYSGGNTLTRSIGGHYPWYQIGLAFSADGKKFTRLAKEESPYGDAGLVYKASMAFPDYPDVTDGVVADPEVVLKDGVFHMWFSSIGYNKAGKGVMAGIGYATSKDGIHWTSCPMNPLQSLWGKTPGRAAQPSVLWNPKEKYFEMWYTNDSEEDLKKLPTSDAAFGFWHAISPDGENWTITDSSRDFSWDKNFPSEKYGLVTGVEAVLKDGKYRLYYGAYGSKNVPSGWPAVWALNLAISQ